MSPKSIVLIVIFAVCFAAFVSGIYTLYEKMVIIPERRAAEDAYYASQGCTYNPSRDTFTCPPGTPDYNPE